MAPAPGTELAIVYTGALAVEAEAAHQALVEDIPGAGLLAITSADLAYKDWIEAWRRRANGEAEARSHIGRLLESSQGLGVTTNLALGFPQGQQ